MLTLTVLPQPLAFPHELQSKGRISSGLKHVSQLEDCQVLAQDLAIARQTVSAPGHALAQKPAQYVSKIVSHIDGGREDIQAVW